MTQQQKTESSFKVILGKLKKPFSDSEIIKCMTELMDTMFEGKQKEKMRTLSKMCSFFAYYSLIPKILTYLFMDELIYLLKGQFVFLYFNF